MKLPGILAVGLALMLAGCGTDSKREAQHELNQASAALKEGNPQTAISRLDKSLAKEPSAEAYQLRAEATLDASRFRRALADAEAGLKLDPDNQRLREVRDLAAACLKLVQGEASIVDNTRYRSEQTSAERRVAPVEQLSFGDITQQNKELRRLIEQNPFWKKSSGMQREAHIQDLLNTEDVFRPLVICYERHQLVRDEAAECEERGKCDLDLLVTFGLLSPLSGVGFGLDEILGKGQLLISSEQRSAILNKLMDVGIELESLSALEGQLASREPREHYQFTSPSFPSGQLTEDVLNSRVKIDTCVCPGLCRDLKTPPKLVTRNQPLERRLSMDRLLGKLHYLCSPHD